MAYKAHRNDDMENVDVKDEKKAKEIEQAQKTTKIAEQLGDPTVKTAAKISEGLGKLTNGKSYEIGNKLNKLNPTARMGQKLINKADETGLLDTASKAADIKGAIDGNSSPDGTKAVPELPGKDTGLSKKSISDSKIESEDEEEEENRVLPKVKAGPILGIVGGFFALIIPLVVVFAIVFSTGDLIKDFFSGIGENIVAFFDNIKDEKNRKNELKFYEELQKVQEELNRREGVCIDVNLITAALTVNVDHTERIHENDGGIDQTSYDSKVEKTEFGDGETDIYVGENDTEYTKKMRKQVALLGAMQIKHNKYIPSKAVPCADVEVVRLIDTEELAAEADISFFDWLMYGDSKKNVISETIRDVANNDEERGLSGLFNTLGKIYVPFWQKAWNKEKNYAYYIYQPANPEGVASDKENLRRNEYVTYQEEYRSTDGKNPKNFDDWYYDYEYEQYKENLDEGEKTLDFDIWKKNYDKSSENGKYRICDRRWINERLQYKNENYSAELDIGDLSTMKDTVFYWNLVDQFIPEYYSEYLPPEGDPSREEKIERIADDIYLLYESMGPNHDCNMKCSSVKIDSSGLCPSGIEVNGELLDLETYVAGVISAENNWHQGDNIEAMKAQAIAARTYAINRTNYCQSPIGNSSATQNYSANANQYAIRAAQETAGMIVTNGNNVVSTEYDASAVKEITNEGYVLNQKDQLIPFGAESSIGMADRHKKVCNKYGGSGNSCHGRGMSQIGARYLQTQGNDYISILRYYYGENISITATSSDSEGGNGGFNGILTMCTNRSGSSPDGDFTGGSCLSSNIAEYANGSVNPDYKFWVHHDKGGYGRFEQPQCTWYAFGRSVQALVNNAGMDAESAYNLLKEGIVYRTSHGKDWYSNAHDKGMFETSNNLYDIRPGSVVSMSGSGVLGLAYGHVAFVEDVAYDESGRPVSYTTTERSGNSCVSNNVKILSNNAVQIGSARYNTYGVIFILGG